MNQEQTVEPKIEALHDFYSSLHRFVLTTPGDSFSGAFGQLRDILSAHMDKAGVLRTDDQLNGFLFSTINGEEGTEPYNFLSAFNGKDNGKGLYNMLPSFVPNFPSCSPKSTKERMQELAYKMHVCVVELMPEINKVNALRKQAVQVDYSKAVKVLKKADHSLDNEALGGVFRALQKGRDNGVSEAVDKPHSVVVPGRDGETWSLKDFIETVENAVFVKSKRTLASEPV